MKRLILYCNSKGGTGKSFAATGHAQLFVRSGIACRLVDTDGEVGHMARMFGVRDESGKLAKDQGNEGVIRFSLHGRERDRVDMAMLLDDPSEVVIIDMPAASFTILSQMETDYGFLSLAHKKGWNVTLVCVATPDPVALSAVTMAAKLDPLADLVLVRNLAFGDGFLSWYGSVPDEIKPANGLQTLQARSGHDLAMARLDPDTVEVIAAKKISFAAAMAPGSPLHSGRKAQVEKWLDALESEWRKAGDVLGFSADSSPVASVAAEELDEVVA